MKMKMKMRMWGWGFDVGRLWHLELPVMGKLGEASGRLLGEGWKRRGSSYRADTCWEHSLEQSFA